VESLAASLINPAITNYTERETDMFTVKKYPKGGKSSLHHVYSCTEYTVSEPDKETGSILLDLQIGDRYQTSFWVSPGAYAFIENSEGKTIEAIRPTFSTEDEG
jgi:hypothetical protein